jgi:hypothetical protein
MLNDTGCQLCTNISTDIKLSILYVISMGFEVSLFEIGEENMTEGCEI